MARRKLKKVKVKKPFNLIAKCAKCFDENQDRDCDNCEYLKKFNDYLQKVDKYV